MSELEVLRVRSIRNPLERVLTARKYLPDDPKAMGAIIEENARGASMTADELLNLLDLLLQIQSTHS